jgi:hypothetical protein
MGTRADFYIRKDKDMEWLGSIGFDGYEIDDAVAESTTEEGFRNEVKKMLDGRDDSTLPSDGWPWPWEDSRTTDFAYIFDNGIIYASNFGYAIYKIGEQPEEDNDGRCPEDYFPNMKSIMNVNWGKGSGLMIIGANPGEK